jgi:hypothetical protein
MNEEHLSSLLLARGLLDQGRAAVNGTGSGAMAAVVLVDLAVETAAKATLGPGAQREMSFGSLIKRVDAEARSQESADAGLSNASRVKKLRSLRNGVQHDGNEPSTRDVERAAVWAEDFVEEIALRFFDRSLRDLSRASLIADPATRASIEAAEELAADNAYSDAAGKLAIAFEQAHGAFKEREPWRKRLRISRHQLERILEGLSSQKSQSSRRSELDRLLKAVPVKLSAFAYRDIVDAVFPTKGFDVKPLARVLEDLLQEVGRIDQRVEAFAVAGDPSEYAWFRQRVPRPVGHWGAEAIEYRTFPPDPPFTQGDYLRALDFVISASLRWQQMPAEPESPLHDSVD